MLDNLLRFKKDQKYIFFDYETEGLNLYSSKPFQLSFIISEGQKIIEKADDYSKLERPFTVSFKLNTKLNT